MFQFMLQPKFQVQFKLKFKLKFKFISAVDDAPSFVEGPHLS